MAETPLDRDPVEVLAAEFIERQRRGENPSIEQYAVEHPDCAESIRQLFPTVVAMEELKLDKEQPSGGRASLGAAQLTQLGDFRIHREIGRGGMGIVYEAEQESLGRHVAVKVLPRQALLDSKHLRRFHREAQTAARLHHTNIVPVFGVGEQDGYHYFVMQLIRGIGLDEILARLEDASSGGTHPSTAGADETSRIAEEVVGLAFGNSSGTSRSAAAEQTESGEVSSAENRNAIAATAATVELSIGQDTVEEQSGDSPLDGLAVGPVAISPGSGQYWQWVARIGLQVADALQYAHAQGVLHRDIKPANLVLDEHEAVWVTDFGLAKALESDDVSRTGDLVGTLRYMAPEQLSGETDARSDVYSLGLTLYELLTLRPAFQDTNRNQLLQRILHGDVPPPRQINSKIPRDLETIVLKSIAQDAGHRYQTAGALWDDLERYLDDRPIQARRVNSIERLWRWCRRNRAVAGLASAALLLLMLAAVVATVGFVLTKRANVEMNKALAGQSRQREIAEGTSELALEALDEIFQQFAPNRIVPSSESDSGETESDEIQVPSQPVLSHETAALLESLLAFYDRLAEQGNDDPRLREKSAEANRRVGDIQQRLGEYEAAEAAYARAIELYRQLDAQSGDQGRFRTELARIHNEMGTVYQATERRDEARQAHLSALGVLEQQTPDAALPPDAKYELARAHYLLGTGSGDHPGPGPQHGRGPDHRRFGRFPHAPHDGGGQPPVRGGPLVPAIEREAKQEHLKKSMALLQEMVATYPAVPDYHYLLACCHREASNRRFSPHGRRDDGAEHTALDMLETLVADFPDVPDYRHDLSQTYARRLEHGPVLKFGDAAAAEQRLRKALVHSGKLVAEHPHVPAYAATHALNHLKLAEIVSRSARGPERDRDQRMAEAVAGYRRALSVQSSLNQRFPSIASYDIRLALAQRSLARLLREQGELDEARSLLESATVSLEQVLQQDPEMRFLHGLLADCYQSLATVLRKLGEDELAEKSAATGQMHGEQLPGGHRGFFRRDGPRHEHRNNPRER